jgi:hypothetical protein
MTHPLRFAAAACLIAFLSGCNTLEPYTRAYSWHPTGANEANLAAMAANPSDLVHGRGTSPSDGLAGAAAVDRLRHDHVKPLLGGSSLSSAAAGVTGN